MTQNKKEEYKFRDTLGLLMSAEVTMHEVQAGLDRTAESLARYERIKRARLRFDSSVPGTMENRIYLIFLWFLENNAAYGVWTECKVGYC